MTNELLPCPFCGGEAEKATSSDGFTSIGCLRCNPLFGVMVQRDTEAEAAAIWNTRHVETCRWEYPQCVNGWAGYVVCSSCGEKYDECVTDTAHYCPNCGAKVVSE